MSHLLQGIHKNVGKCTITQIQVALRKLEVDFLPDSSPFCLLFFPKALGVLCNVGMVVAALLQHLIHHFNSKPCRVKIVSGHLEAAASFMPLCSFMAVFSCDAVLWHQEYPQGGKLQTSRQAGHIDSGQRAAQAACSELTCFMGPCICLLVCLCSLQRIQGFSPRHLHLPVPTIN